ncbi:MAG: alpha/beta fold hydrolase [Desulfobacterales bacterium]
MQETPFFFFNEGKRLYGILHTPGEAMRPEGFVFCAPFAEEKLWAHRPLVNFARLLARHGYPVLRFDNRGSGDSEGDFHDTTVRTMISDTRSAVVTLQEKTENLRAVSLLGLRLGASVAALAATRIESVKSLVLWEPVVDGGAYARSLLRINLATQAAVYGKILENSDRIVSRLYAGETANVDGYEMSLELYRGIAEMDLGNPSLFGAWKRPSLIVAINRKRGVKRPDLERLQRCLEGSVLLEAEEEPFWKEINQAYFHAPDLFKITLKWLGHDQG